MTQLTASDDPTTFAMTEVTTLAEINRQSKDILCELPVLQCNFLYCQGMNHIFFTVMSKHHVYLVLVSYWALF